ncbi:MAG: Asp-tRNA(Asn)/Glu-tRNA(Gln) amidotransferase subunit GatC [Candidatus Omnitrophota bacterium]
MELSKETVKSLGALARMELTQEESGLLSAQLEDILRFIDKLKELDTSKTAPTSHILPINNVLREDKPGRSLAVARALENSPQKDGDLFAVPKVIE